MIPETRYVRTQDGVHIAYQVVGEGPVDLVFHDGWVSNIDVNWDIPELSRFLRALAERARLIVLDRRGSGVSDRPATTDSLTLEKGVDDTLAVLDAIGSERPVVFGFEDGGILGLLLAAGHPDRVAGLVLFAPWVSYWQSDDQPWGLSQAEAAEWEQMVAEAWGTERFARWNLEGIVGDEVLSDPEQIRTWARYWRLSATPANALAIERMLRETDVRAILPTVRVPTLVMHRAGDDRMYQGGRWIAERIPGARFVELPGSDHPPYLGDARPIMAELDRFIGELRAEAADLDRVLATVLFTDIVGSTEQAARHKDRAWAEVLDRHHDLVRGLLARYRGTEIDTAGDGFLAVFDGPARAIRAARAIVEGVRSLGLEVRAGCHTGEIERSGDDVRGIAVHIGARIGALAGPSEVWTSQTVRDLVAGSGLVFEDAGEHELKGVPDRWRLYRVVG